MVLKKGVVGRTFWMSVLSNIALLLFYYPPCGRLPVAAATVSRGTLQPVIYLGRECAASVTSYPPPVWIDVASCNIYTVPRCYRDRPACPS
eukprot:scaffold83681_cov53-Phaeocystis_antarctica.AAC.1